MKDAHHRIKMQRKIVVEVEAMIVRVAKGKKIQNVIDNAMMKEGIGVGMKMTLEIVEIDVLMNEDATGKGQIDDEVDPVNAHIETVATTIGNEIENQCTYLLL